MSRLGSHMLALQWNIALQMAEEKQKIASRGVR